MAERGFCGRDDSSNNIAERFAAFQWHTQEIDGHDIDAIRKAIDNARAEKDGQALSYATA